ncbi:MAG: uracil-DNA glycosylase [Nitrospira sp.]|nr:uracil-DNA glycosylase [Candidatus Manganitrophaceae bacterium]HIL34515.1 uracil-DNA glycosylase [Candidatus Manganitrophaceae bacterium]
MGELNNYQASGKIKALTQEMVARLKWYQDNGVLSWKRTAAQESSVEQSADGKKEPIATDPTSQTGLMTLEAIREEMGDCQRCTLCSTRTNIVFGTGNPHASLLFVGEGPGRDEDLQGLPFVGRAGQLLTRMIAAMGFSRDEVYIANIVKCRPPENRNPKPDEIATCRPFLHQQISAIRPRVICALGTFSAQTLLSTEERISDLRGKFHDFFGIKVLPTFHPAYLLRNPSQKKHVWEDLQLIMAELKKKPVPDEAAGKRR